MDGFTKRILPSKSLLISALILTSTYAIKVIELKIILVRLSKISERGVWSTNPSGSALYGAFDAKWILSYQSVKELE